MGKLVSACFKGLPGSLDPEKQVKSRFLINDNSIFYNNNLGYTWIWLMEQNEIIQFYLGLNQFYLCSLDYYPITFTAEMIEQRYD